MFRPIVAAISSHGFSTAVLEKMVGQKAQITPLSVKGVNQVPPDSHLLWGTRGKDFDPPELPGVTIVALQCNRSPREEAERIKNLLEGK